ncbi:MAG: diacylglycerol kinase family lipid kinase [Clostridiales bacterium]|jgi:YegS/Rv2252/BmrU family lipid kinase|nr:diacylglycerol kinase family lipid kinase [Clostridiales bacterium]
MYYFIWNPVAGKGGAKQALPVIESAMNERGLRYSLLKTEYPGHATELAKAAAEAPQAWAITAVGGDGTIMETAAGLVGANVPLACIPLGNGNDYMSGFFDMRGYRTVEAITKRSLEALFHGKPQTVDIIAVNGGYAMNIGNIGLDADVADLGSKLKRVFGSFSYLIAMIASIFTYKPFNAAVTVDGGRKQGRFTLIAACNGARYGGKFVIAPHARVDDGKLTLCLVDSMPRLKILALFPLALMGRHTFLKEVHFVECERVDIEYNGSAKMCLDGNIEIKEGPVSFKLTPAALEIIADSGVLNNVKGEYSNRV